jgi:uncharacterized protein YneF (UPF0154 family)
MTFFDKMMTLDRRWVYLFLALVCFITYYGKFQIPIPVNSEVRSVYDKIESLPEGSIVFLGIDYDPSTQAELHPMTYAMMEHCFRRKLRVLTAALSQNGPGMAEQIFLNVTDSMKLAKTYNGVEYPARDIIRGVDYVFLGYKPYYQLTILSMGQNFRIPYPTDYYGTRLDSIPMMQGVNNYSQVAFVCDLTAGNVADAWISYGQSRFNFELALGLTGVMAADYYPFLNSGQLIGIMGGLFGAAQYEQLADNPGLAKDGMRVQVFAHLVIILFIIIANVGFFVSRRKQGN